MTKAGIVFTLVLALSTVGGAAGLIRTRRAVGVDHGVEVNERITSLAGALVWALTAAIGVTIVWIGDLLPAHYLVGLLMLGPLAVKLGSTGHRFVRYYGGDAAHRRAGPPQIVLRLSAPILVVSTVALFATGIELWLFGYRYGAWWFQAHIVSFLFWTACLVLHLLGHTRRSAEAVVEEVAVRSRDVRPARGLLVASLLLGAALAAASLLYASPFPAPGGAG